MSFRAITWAMSLQFSRSSEKFLLVCLANYADEHGVCYPSIERLEQDTCQDRKTIIANLKRLIEAGYLEDTGRRVGKTGGVIVYRLVGVPELCRVHYVYKLTHPETGEYYFGKRSFDGDPETDIYRGSGKWPRQMHAEGVSLLREIVGMFESSEEAVAAEAQILRSITDDPLCRNDERPWVKKQNALAAKNGTVPKTEQFQNSLEAVPFFPGSSPKNGTQNLLGKRQSKPSVSVDTRAKAKPALPPWLDAEAWGAFVAMRKQIKKPMTDRAVELMLRKLERMHEAGVDVKAALEQSILHCWQDVYEPKDRGRAPHAPAANNNANGGNRGTRETVEYI